MAKIMLIISVLLATSVCYAGPEVGPWEISMGVDCVLTFQPEHIPSTNYYFAYAVVGRPDEIIVSTARYQNQSGKGGWQPKGLPMGHYVYVLNFKSEKVSLMAWDRFKQLEIVIEVFFPEMISTYPELNYRGEPVNYIKVVPIRRKGKEFVASASFDCERADKTTFGLPSIIPFMGRKKWIEKETYHSGTVFLEVFDKERPLKPIVQFQRSFRNLSRLPEVGEMARWTQGAEQPFLVIVDSGSWRKKRKGRIFLIRPRFGTSE